MKNIDRFYEALAVEAASELREKARGLAREVRLGGVEQAMDAAEIFPEDLSRVDMPEFVNRHLRPAMRIAMAQLVDEASWAVQNGIDDVIRDT